MTQRKPAASLVAIAAVLSAPAWAQDAEPAGQAEAQQEQTPPTEDEPDMSSGNTIVVTGERQRGQVETEQLPLIELGEEEIAAYGADSLADLVEQLAPQTGSGRGRGEGRPVFLVNGQRVSSFREFRRYPPEAIEKVEVFPEEVALQYGYPADQRVINFILKDNFTSREIEGEFGMPTAGGYASGETEASMLTINGSQRFQIAGEFGSSSLLTEAERDIIQTPGSTPTVPGDPDPAAYRSLATDSENFELETTYNTALGQGADAAAISVNANLTRDFSRSLSGLDTVILTDGDASALRTLDADPLTRRRKTTTAALASSLNKPLGDWDLAVTADASRTWSVSAVDRRRDAGFLQELVDAGELAIDAPLPAVPLNGRDRAASEVTSAQTLATLRGQPILLPSGEVRVTFDTGYSWSRIASTDTRADLGETVLKRGDLSAGVNVGIPLASAREDFLSPLGELNLNLGGGINHLSDFGTLTDWTAGLNWRPTERLSLQASYIVREAAPGLGQLGDPIIEDFNVPVFDFATGRTVLATTVSGGNPFLLAETQRDIKLAANYELDLFDRANVVVEYFRNRSSDVTEGFPLLTPEIEAAFPDRVTRAPDGELLRIDRRPVTFAERNSSRIRYGFNLFGRIGREQAEGETRRGGRGGWRAAAAAASQNAAAGAAPGRGGLDAERMAAIRQRLCDGWNPADPNAPMPDLSDLPERMLARLRGEDGTIDRARVVQLRERLCSADPTAAGQGDAAGTRGSGDGSRGRGGRSGFGGRGGDEGGQGRWNLSLYHTVELENDALIAPGVPRLDLLDGDALGSGGVPRHRAELEGGLFKDGLGLRMSANYESGTRVEGSGLAGSEGLIFGDLVTVDMRAFANLEQLDWLTGSDPGFLKGTRLSLRVDNLFDTRREVTDSAGLVPLSYQPGLIDPVGRSFEIEFRKIF